MFSQDLFESIYTKISFTKIDEFSHGKQRHENKNATSEFISTHCEISLLYFSGLFGEIYMKADS